MSLVEAKATEAAVCCRMYEQDTHYLALLCTLRVNFVST